MNLVTMSTQLFIPYADASEFVETLKKCVFVIRRSYWIVNKLLHRHCHNTHPSSKGLSLFKIKAGAEEYLPLKEYSEGMSKKPITQEEDRTTFDPTYRLFTSYFIDSDIDELYTCFFQ